MSCVMLSLFVQIRMNFIDSTYLNLEMPEKFYSGGNPKGIVKNTEGKLQIHRRS